MMSHTPRVAIVGGCRTPFARAGGALSKQSYLDLGIHAVRSLLTKLNLDASRVDELIFSTVLLDPRFPNGARELVLRAGLAPTLPAHFISNNCISGLVAVNMISEGIRSGRLRCGIAGGSESMSRPSLSLRREAEDFYLSLSRTRKLGHKLKTLLAFRPRFLFPLAPSPKEPSTGLTMGEHCELMAQEFSIVRTLQDQLALSSHMHAARAQKDGYLAEEIAPLQGLDRDNIIRADTSLDKLSKLPAVFDRSAKGTLTAGNSSALTDGASAICLMAEEEARRQGRDILAIIEAVEFAAIAPADGLLMAPCLALPRLLERSNLRISDVDIFEIHEAFAAQVAANMLIWEKGWSKYPAAKPIGKVPQEKINVNGGSIALGHPFAATGGRLILAAANHLKRKALKSAVISVCAAGAMACAMLLRRD